MSDILTRLEKYRELDELESIFYNIYMEDSVDQKLLMLQYYSRHIQNPNDHRKFHGIISLAGPTSSIPEDAFFDANQTIFINRHPRYMPVFEHRHDFFEIQFLLKEQLHQTIGDTNVSLRPGDICFIAPQASHALESNSHDTLLVNILLRSETLQSAFSNCLVEGDEISTFFMRILCGHAYHPYLLWHTNGDERIGNLLLDMLDCQQAPDIYTDRLLRTMVEQLFLYLLRDHPNNFSTGTLQKKDDENILSILKYAQANYSTITLGELAKHFNYNEAYLSRTLKSYLGCSFSKYFINVRLNRAAQLLTAGQAPISDVMLQVGYTDKTHFYRSFRKKFGMTPNSFRKEHTQENGQERTFSQL